jgi:hypothetical protein
MTHTQTQGADSAGTFTGRPQPLTILYTNWRGETAVRRILIDAIAYGNEALGLAYGWNEWHPEEQWLLSATDADKGERRTFAMAGIKAWGQAAVDAALASSTPDPAATPGVPDSLREAFAAATDSPVFVHDFADPAVSSAPGCQDVSLSFVTPDHITAAFMGNGLAGTIDQARKDAVALAAAWNHVRALIAAQPAGQAGDAGAARTVEFMCEGQVCTAEVPTPSSDPNSSRSGAEETEDAVASAIEGRWTDLIGPAMEGGNIGWKRRDLCREFAKAVLAARPEAPSDAGWRERVRHVKRGTEYEVLGEAEAQVSKGESNRFGEWRALYERDKLTVYRGSDGKLWCRFPDEMRDGRFETITPPSDPAPSGQAEG